MSQQIPRSGIQRRPPLPAPQQPGLQQQRSARAIALAIFIQTIVMGLICTGCLVIYRKIVEPDKLPERIPPLLANLFGATLLVGVLQLIRGRTWSWPVVGMAIIFLASVGLWLTLKFGMPNP